MFDLYANKVLQQVCVAEAFGSADASVLVECQRQVRQQRQLWGHPCNFYTVKACNVTVAACLLQCNGAASVGHTNSSVLMCYQASCLLWSDKWLLHRLCCCCRQLPGAAGTAVAVCCTHMACCGSAMLAVGWHSCSPR